MRAGELDQALQIAETTTTESSGTQFRAAVVIALAAATVDDEIVREEYLRTALEYLLAAEERTSTN